MAQSLRVLILSNVVLRVAEEEVEERSILGAGGRKMVPSILGDECASETSI